VPAYRKLLEALEKKGVGSGRARPHGRKASKGVPLPIRWKVLLALADDTVLMSTTFSKLVPATEPLPRFARQPIGQQDAV